VNAHPILVGVPLGIAYWLVTIGLALAIVYAVGW